MNEPSYPMSAAATQTYLRDSNKPKNFLKEQERNLENLKRKMATDYYEVENFSFVSPGDYLYIIEKDRPQKIKCIYVEKYREDSGSNRFPESGSKVKNIYFVRVSNTDNSKIINDKGEQIANFDKKNEIITPTNESYTDYDNKIITGKELFFYFGSNNEITEKYKKQMITLTIYDSILSEGKIKSCTPKNDKLANCFSFWKKKLLSAITGEKSASTFGGKRKKTKRRYQTRKKSRRYRKNRPKYGLSLILN